MRTKSIVLAVLGTAFLFVAFVGIPVSKRSARGSGGAPVATSNGDVNGDGKIDITDAIYLLGYLFQHGDAPVPVACADTTPPIWPPKVSQIVGVQSEAPVPVVPGTTKAIYQVPDGQWLVVTDITIQFVDDNFEGVSPGIYEDLGGKQTIKFGPHLFPPAANAYHEANSGNTYRYLDSSPRHFSSPVGVVFSPGSNVLIRYTGGLKTQNISYNLIGYLTDRQ